MVKELSRLTANPEAAGGTPWPIRGAGSASGLQNSPFYFLMGWKCLMVDYEVKCCLLLTAKWKISLMKQRDPCGWTSVKRAKELIEQGLLSQEMRYFVKEKTIYVLVVVFWRSQSAELCQEPLLTPQGFCTGHRRDGAMLSYCGIWTREVFIKALGDFGSRKITF